MSSSIYQKQPSAQYTHGLAGLSIPDFLEALRDLSNDMQDNAPDTVYNSTFTAAEFVVWYEAFRKEKQSGKYGDLNIPISVRTVGRLLSTHGEEIGIRKEGTRMNKAYYRFMQ